MSPMIKTFVLLLLLLLLFHSSSGEIEVFKDGVKPMYPVHKAVIQQKRMRNLVEVNAMLDYDYGGPNPRHDPTKGPPAPGHSGGNGKIP